MEKRNTTNKGLDTIGIAALRASVLRDDELERVLENPYLFASIKRRIRLDEAREIKPVRVRFTLNVRSIAGALSMAVIAVTVFGLASLKFMNRPATDTVRIQPPQVAINPPIAVLPDETAVLPNTPPAVASPKRVYQAEPAVIKTRAPRRTYSETVAEPEPDSRTMEFYPLAGTSPDAMGEGRIVRVDLPRASLVALGANLPPDNGRPLVKTDILVGQDGVPRAIRLVD
jgi:hypothetical protein